MAKAVFHHALADIGRSVFILACAALSQNITYFETGEEFAGPFPSWKNVKTDFSAKGDGATDDAPAIQAALNAMKTVNTNTWAVLYFPAGTYRINSTLTTTRVDHQDYLGISIIGEDPSATILSWNGPTGQNMFNLDAWYCKVGRLTFSGNGTANVGLMRDGGFSSICELSDLFFENMQTGIALGGPSGNGQAEHAIERCRFSNCSNSGIITDSWNTMDIWIWYCLFEDCGNGVYNSKGGYHAYENVLLRSRIADFGSSNAMPFTIVNNTSINSKCFIGGQSWGFQGLLYVQGNRIYNTLDAIAIANNSQYGGVASIIGNTIRSRNGNSGSCVGFTAGNHLSVDNTFTIANPIAAGGRTMSIGQRIVAPTAIAVPTDLQLPGTPAMKSRKIFEVQPSTGGDADEIQRKINAAANEPAGTNPIVHIPKGIYSLSATITIPAAQMQIVGDGGNENGTVFTWNGTGTEPGFKLLGPSRVTLRDMSINFVNSGADALTIENSDQAGGRIFCDQAYCGGNASNVKCTMAILVDGIENSDVTYINAGWGEFTNTGVMVKGGPTLSAGGVTNGQVSLLLGALGNNENRIIDVQNGGRVLAYGYRDETPVSGSLLNLGPTSSGAVSIAGMSWAAMPSATIPFIAINGFNGTLAYVGTSAGSGYNDNAGSMFIEISGNGSNTHVLGAAAYFSSQNSTSAANVWKDHTSPAAQAAFLNCFGGGVNQPIVDIPNVVNQVANAAIDTQAVRTMLSQILNLRIEPPNSRQAGTTDVKLVRMFVRASKDRMGLVFKRDAASSVFGTLQPDHKGARLSVDNTVIAGVGGYAIPSAARGIAVYDATGKAVLKMDIRGANDRYAAGKQIRSFSRKGVVVIRVIL
jgi:hypothetical protein